jgi:hypothetical protein
LYLHSTPKAKNRFFIMSSAQSLPPHDNQEAQVVNQASLPESDVGEKAPPPRRTHAEMMALACERFGKQVSHGLNAIKTYLFCSYPEAHRSSSTCVLFF